MQQPCATKIDTIITCYETEGPTGNGITECGLPHGVFHILKFAPGANPETDEPVEVITFENDYTNQGSQDALDLIAGIGGTAFSNANAHIGSGDSSTATTASMNDMQASTNKMRKAMDSTYPSRSGQVMTWQATFADSDAQWNWQEVGLFNASSSGKMLSRKTQNIGVKGAVTWVVRYTITLP